MELNEQKLQEVLTEQRKEYQIYLGTLAEDFQSQVKLIAESVSGIQQQLETLRDMVAQNTEDIETIKADMEVMKADLQLIKQNLKRKVDTEEFEGLEKRVLYLEKRFGSA